MSSQDEPSAKRQRTYEADGPVEDDKTAREKLKEAGFDPGDVHTARSDVDELEIGWHNITPMTHFACLGDLPMCRYLYHVRGAVTTTAADELRTRSDEGVFWYPILSAAYRYKVDVIKWLCQHGAKSELLKVSDGISAISTCFFASKKLEYDALQESSIDLAKWLVLEGLLDQGSVGNTVAHRLHKYLYELQHENQFWQLRDMPRLFVSWMEELLSPTDAFHAFLLGTVRNPQYSVSEMKKMLGKRIGSPKAASMLVDDAVSSGRAREIWDQLMADTGRTTSSNSCLASFPGVLEKIGDFVGIIKSKTKLKRVTDAKALAQIATVAGLQRWLRD